MKNILVTAAMLLLIIGCGSDPVAPTFQAAEYFPLHVGDTWKYKDSHSAIFEYSFVSTEVFSGKSYYKMLKYYQGQLSDSMYYRVADSKVYLFRHYSTGLGDREYSYIDFANGKDSTAGYVKSTEDSIQLQAGMFYSAKTVSWYGVFDEGPPYETYSPGIGLIKRREIFGNSFDLIYAKVGGKVYQ